MSEEEFYDKHYISEALDYGLQVWRTVPEVRDKIIRGVDSLNRMSHKVSNSYPKTPVDCLISELRDYFFDDGAVLSRDEFEQRVVQFDKEVSDGNVS